RPLSTRVGGLLLLLVLACGLIGTTIVGLVGVDPHPTRAESEASAPDKTAVDESDADEAAADETESDETPNVQPDDELITVRGQVIDPDGKPVAGAEVFVLKVFSDEEPLDRAVSNGRGQFEVQYR